MTNPFANASAQELLTALETAGRTPSLDLIRACTNHRRDLIPGLLDLLATVPDPGWDDNDPRWYAPIHAGHLLIFFREPEAIPIFMRLLRDPAQEYLLDWFSTKLASYGLGILQPLSDLLNDSAAPAETRMVACETLEQLVAEFPTERARVIDILRSVLPPLDRNGVLAISSPRPPKPNIVFTAAASTLAVLSDFASRPQVEALYRDKWIDTTFLGDEKRYVHTLLHPKPLQSKAFNLIETYEDILESEKNPANWDKSSITELQRQLHELNAQRAAIAETTESDETPEPELSTLDDLAPAPFIPAKPAPASRPGTSSTRAVPKPTPQPIRRDTPKIGRNDSCFCGSGRKYKHCHGKS